MERYKEIERSIIKTYRKSIWKRFIAGISQYELINEGDKIGVCISGGKDSMLMAKLVQEIQRHGVKPFEAEYIVMDPGYNPENRQRIIDNAALLNIPIHIFRTNIFDSVVNVDDHHATYARGCGAGICIRKRRSSVVTRSRSGIILTM